MCVWENRFLQGIRFHTQRKDEANATSIRYPEGNCYRYNDTPKMHESNGNLTWWRQRIPRYCCWSLAKIYIDAFYVNNLPRSRTSNLSRLNKRKCFQTKNTTIKRYLSETITVEDNADDLAIFVNTSAQVNSLLRSLEQAAEGIVLYANTNKIEFMWFKSGAYKISR